MHDDQRKRTLVDERWAAAAAALLVASGCSHDDKVQGPVYEQRSQTEAVADLDACETSVREASVVLSLKKLNAYNKERLFLEPTISTKKGSVVLKLVELGVEPVNARYGDKERVGVRVHCKVELLAASDHTPEKYEASVVLPHADELSYWGGYLTPTFTWKGTARPAKNQVACPLASLPKPAPPALPPTAESRPGMFREAWLTVRGFTKGESLAATIVLPIVAYLSGKAQNYFRSFFTRLFLLITFIVAVPFAVLSFIRLAFIWP
jgi:hypothetical protein